jgi:hypothetical protein
MVVASWESSSETRVMNGTPSNLFQDVQQELMNLFHYCATLKKNSESEPVLDITGILDAKKYKFVAKIMNQIESKFGEMVDKELDLQESEPAMPLLIDKILGSKDYSDLVQSIGDDAEEVVSEILEQMREVPSLSNVKDESFSDLSVKSMESWSVGSLASGICPDLDELKLIANKLGPNQSLSTRLEGATQLKAFSVGDLLSDEFWPISRKCMNQTVIDPDIHIANIGMGLFARSIRIAPQYLVPDIYISYVKQLETLTNITKEEVVHGLQLKEPHTVLKLKQYRLLNQMMTYLPICWSRFPEQCLVEIMDATVQLMSQGHSSYKMITPLHLLSLVDPKWNWYDTWMNSHLGRRHLLSAMEGLEFLPEVCTLFLKHVRSYENYSHSTTRKEQVESIEESIKTHDMNYLHFVATIQLLSKVLLYKLGRNCFPIDLDVTPNQLISHFTPELFLKLMVQKMSQGMGLSSDDNQSEHFRHLRLCRIVSGAIKELANADDECKMLVSTEDLLDSLMMPLQNGLEMGTIPNEDYIMAITDALSHIASSNLGQITLLQNQNVLDTIAQIVSRWCSKELEIPNSLIVGFIYILRQFYRTCEGLDQLNKYDLHARLSKRKKAETEERLDDILTDNILNFGATPYGLLLLEDTGCMEQCVRFMFARYQRNIQVSKCERFGYGTLVSQIATSKAGMNALINTGWIQGQVAQLKMMLESENHFDPQEIDLDDPKIRKTISNIKKLLTTFTGFHTCLTLESDQQVKESIHFLIQTLVLRSSDQDIVTYDESRFVGLSLFNHFIHNLDTIILLEHKFQYFAKMLNLHQNSFVLAVGENQARFVIDANSTMVNHILLASLTIGGPKEKKLPPKEIRDEIPEDYAQWLFQGRGIPKPIDLEIHFPDRIVTLREELQRNAKLEQLKDWYLRVGSKRSLHFADTALILDSMLKEVSVDTTFSSEDLSGYDKLGVIMAERYASKFIRKEQKSAFIQTLSHAVSKFKNQSEEFLGFDWFVATIVLIYEGNPQSIQVLEKMKSLSNIRSLWLHLQVETTRLFKLSHCVEAILESELPQVTAAIKLSGCTPSQFIQKWIRQAFWNVIDFEWIQHYILSSLLLGIDYQIYFCVMLFKKSTQRILCACRDGKLISLQEEPWECDYNVEYAITLEKKYRNRIFAFLQ